MEKWSKAYKQKSEMLRTIPGFDPLTAMLFILGVGELTRFTSFDALNGFVGLCQDSDSGGDTERHTGITQRRHKALRSALVESAWQLIRRCSDVRPLPATYQTNEIAKGNHSYHRKITQKNACGAALR